MKKKNLRLGQTLIFYDFLRLKMVKHQNSWEKDSHPPKKRYSMYIDPWPVD